MDNYYNANPLRILVTNPYTSKVIRCVSIPSDISGGVHRSTRNVMQLTDFSILDKPTEELKRRTYIRRN